MLLWLRGARTKYPRRVTTPRYRIDKAESLTFAQARSANGTHQAQILASLAIRKGTHVYDLDAFAETLAGDFEVGEGDLLLERLTFTREGDATPTYEMWTYFGEHGVVCEADSDIATPVHCVQEHFWSTDPDDLAAVALAAALDQAEWP
jgi:hypothetical protein